MKRTRRRRTGFSVPELMIALLISAMLLLATMIAGSNPACDRSTAQSH